MKKEEFESTLQKPLEYWGTKSKNEVGELLGAETAAMIGFNQRNPHHCHDLFMHTLHTVDTLVERSPALLKTAAFFHDIGKPSVAAEKEGRLVFYGHAKKSAEIAEPLLFRIGYNTDDIKTICFFIRHHDDFISWVFPEEEYDHNNPYLVEVSYENLLRHIESVRKKAELPEKQYTWGLWRELLLLCWADASAQAELVYMNGVQVDSRERKINKIDRLLFLTETVNEQ